MSFHDLIQDLQLSLNSFNYFQPKLKSEMKISFTLMNFYMQYQLSDVLLF